MIFIFCNQLLFDTSVSFGFIWDLQRRNVFCLKLLHKISCLCFYWPLFIEWTSSDDLLFASGRGPQCILSTPKDSLVFLESLALYHLIGVALWLVLYEFTDTVQYNEMLGRLFENRLFSSVNYSFQNSKKYNLGVTFYCVVPMKCYRHWSVNSERNILFWFLRNTCHGCLNGISRRSLTNWPAISQPMICVLWQEIKYLATLILLDSPDLISMTSLVVSCS